MDPQAKKVWIKALRSDRYEQTNFVLCRQWDDDKQAYCCLGVLAEECVVGDWVPHARGIAELWLEVRRGKALMKDLGMLPPAALKQVGLSKEAARHLASMNDHDGRSFKQIANWIEKNL